MDLQHTISKHFFDDKIYCSLCVEIFCRALFDRLLLDFIQTNTTSAIVRCYFFFFLIFIVNVVFTMENAVKTATTKIKIE